MISCNKAEDHHITPLFKCEVSQADLFLSHFLVLFQGHNLLG